LQFIIDFLIIHPFGDENGRVACMLADLMLVKKNIKPVHFYIAPETAIQELSKQLSIHKTISPLLDFIREYRADALS